MRLNLYFVRETTPPPGETLLPVLVRLLRHDCTGAPVPEEEDRLDRAIWIVQPRPD